MAFLPLSLPPGIYRPGTRYDARGRWYHANLVRWHDAAMQPIGGWQPFERSDLVAVSGAYSDDGGAITDETADANSAGANDVVLTPAVPQVGDAFYIGYSFRFTEIQINVGTAGVGGAVVWEYWNGSAFVALSGVSDSTNAFRVSGTNAVTFTAPSNWAKRTISTSSSLYFVRARITTAGASGATATQAWVGTGPVDVDEPVRGLLAWRGNNESPRLVLGTPTKIYVFSSGVLADVTPVGFTTGGADAVSASGAYGSGAYGGRGYGVGDPAQSTITEANTWQIDTFGEDLVACAYSDGKIYYWDTSAGGVMAQLTNSPSTCKGVVVTPERFIMALAAGGDARKVSWPNQEATTEWTSTSTNQAGDFTLVTPGEILAGRKMGKETLIWTDVDLHAATYIGGESVYSFRPRGEKCGTISRRAMTVDGSRAFWMGQRGFFIYEGGFVKELPCDVGDYVFSDMNRTQASKIHCSTLSEFGEVTWYYCSGGSTEIDRYVTYTREGHWNIGDLARTSAVDRDAYPYPIAVDPNGVCYQHETGTSYLDPNGNALLPNAESGPVEVAQGDNVFMVRQFIPDEKSLGDASISLYGAMYPTADETTHGPYTLANPTDVRATARQFRIYVEQVSPNWRYGTPRLEGVLGGLR